MIGGSDGLDQTFQRRVNGPVRQARIDAGCRAKARSPVAKKSIAEERETVAFNPAIRASRLAACRRRSASELNYGLAIELEDEPVGSGLTRPGCWACSCKRTTT